MIGIALLQMHIAQYIPFSTNKSWFINALDIKNCSIFSGQDNIADNEIVIWSELLMCVINSSNISALVLRLYTK